MLTKGLALNKQEKLEVHRTERKAVDLEHHKSLFSEWDLTLDQVAVAAVRAILLLRLKLTLAPKWAKEKVRLLMEFVTLVTKQEHSLL